MVATALAATITQPMGVESSPEAKKQVSVWKVEQISQLEGPITLYIGTSGVKMVVPAQHVVVVAVPPKWDVTLVNVKDKLGLNFTSEVWKGRGFRLVDRVVKSVEKSRTATKWRGQPAALMVRTVDTSDPVKEQVEMLYRESAGRSTEFRSEEFLYEKWMKLEPGAQKFLCGIYRVPDFNGLMLRRTRSYPNGRVDTALDTKDCKQVTISTAEFVCPTTFKVAKNINEVTNQKKKKMQAAGLLEDMFLDK
ncbi:MAG: hypothetical protein C0469_15995 [Cyanobacteria bacterium DS2.3.42]|nr:hypothetical protein [Cyanobacteria bacterium DS2.3.42]